MSTEDPIQTACPPWHGMSTDEVVSKLETSLSGLGTEAAAQRLSEYGPNRLPEAKQRSALMRLLAQFHNVLIYVLLAAALVTFALQHWLDTAVIVGVVVVNALIGFVQEGKAEDALAAIRQMLSPRAMVIRDGRRRTIDAADIVPGDIMPLQAGDKISADLRILQAKGLRIEEAALTGESVPVEKTHEPCPDDAVAGRPPLDDLFRHPDHGRPGAGCGHRDRHQD